MLIGIRNALIAILDPCDKIVFGTEIAYYAISYPKKCGKESPKMYSTIYWESSN
jgi:hypothetical protein